MPLQASFRFLQRLASRPFRRGQRRQIPVLLLALLLGPAAQAGTIVRIGTTVGDFSIELYDGITWRTVQNFLGYVNRGDYNQTYIHRTQDQASQGIGVIQGGGFRFQSFFGPVPIVDEDNPPPSVLNEPVFSNERGTIAMAKFADDPNSATSQWFFNTSDNSDPLDTSNGGFTVFGKVLGGEDGSDLEAGMEVLDKIAGLQKIRPCLQAIACTRADFAPITSESYEGRPDEELVFLTMEVVSRYSAAVNLFDPVSLSLIGAIELEGGSTAYRASFTVSLAGDDVVIGPRGDSLLLLDEAPDGAAVFNASTQQLLFPRIELTATESLCDVAFQLTNPETLRFTLAGYGSCQGG